jgi:hypothetical protein
MTMEMTEARFPVALEEHGQALNAVAIEAARANETIDRQLAEYRKRFQERNEIACPPDVEREVSGRYRQQFDADLRQRATTLEQEHRTIGAAIETAITTARVLPNFLELAPTDDLKAIRHHLEVERAERRVDGMTRAALVALYTGTTDERDRTLVALIERELTRLPLRDDPANDVTAMLQLQRAIEARQAARIPRWLLDARVRHGEIRSLHFDHLHRHLTRDGRGIAAVPR